MIACFGGYIELTDFFKIFEWKDILIWNHANWTHIRREIFWNVRSTSKLSSACKYSRESNFKRGIGTSGLTGLSTIKPKTACPQPVKYIQKNEVVHEQRLPKACNCWITSPNEINKIILLNAVKIFIANATPTTTVGICFRFQSEKTQNVATSHYIKSNWRLGSQNINPFPKPSSEYELQYFSVELLCKSTGNIDH